MLIIAFVFTLRRGAILSSHFMNTADVLLKKRDHLGLLAISSRHSEVIARVVQRTLDFSTKHPNAPFESIREIAETEGSAQAAALQHRVTYLDLGSRDRHGTHRRLARHPAEQEARLPGADRGRVLSHRRMRFRRRSEPMVLGFQIAPMVDVLLVLLCFFIVTWSLTRRENELDVKVPSAQNAKESNPVINQTVINVKSDGSVVWNRKAVPKAELVARLKELAELFPDYAIILRGDENTPYKFIMDVMDTCREANIWNVAFAASKPE
jgi:biopolymer transport protein ExbD